MSNDLKWHDPTSGACQCDACRIIRNKNQCDLINIIDDPVNHPKHYTRHPSGVECIEVTRHMGFNLGNAMKYIWRAGEKGKEIEDLEKAVWYLTDEISRLKKLEENKK